MFTAGGHLSPRGVFVETKNPGGGLSDYPFHLNVNCSTKRANRVGRSSNANGGLVRAPNGTSVVKLGVGQSRGPAPRRRLALRLHRHHRRHRQPAAVLPRRSVHRRRAPSARGVFVETKNPGGGLSDYPFHLNVGC